MSASTGAEAVHWKLSDLYSGVDDPALDRDLETAVKLAQELCARHRGQLERSLGAALEERARIAEILDTMFMYLYLERSTDAANSRIQQRMAQAHEVWSQAEAEYLTFFDHELARMPEEVFSALVERNEVVRHHRPTLEHIRRTARYLLDEVVERALTLRAPFGPQEWSDYSDEWEAELRFSVDGADKTLPEILHIINNDPDGGRRAQALEAFHRGIGEQRYDRFMARTLNVVVGAKAVEDRERGYASPMSARNIHNQVDDATVEALHDAVADLGAREARRYYRLLSAHLCKTPLRWSDRNAPLPFQDSRSIPWTECVQTVRSAFGSFSPALCELVDSILDQRWVDAPPGQGKLGGAYNYTSCAPGGRARSYTFLNYLGSPRDVMTVAHELGHGVHGLLAAKAQGALQFRAPMVYAETASIFGEMTTFRYVLDRAGSDQEKLGLLMGKANDFINSVVRQISFSNFERAIHEQRRSGKLTVEDFNGHWMAVTRAFYGADGDIFTYEHTDNLWAYVGHFLRPFYVYAYAFGELFTQSLFAVQDRFGAQFEAMYLDLLRAGGSKGAVELMAPFGLDPTDPAFWRDGISGSLSKWLDQAEALSAAMGVAVPAPGAAQR
jgi:oligoendopeptidase F